MNKKVDLLNGAILPTMTKLALPIMATSLLQMAYNLVDMIWIGRVGSKAVASVGAASMYIWLSMGIVAFAKVGGQVKVGHSLGCGKKDEAITYAQTSLQMGLFLGAIFGTICLLGSPLLIGFFKLNGANVVTSAIHYLRICGGGVIFSFIILILTGIMMAMGNSTTPFFVTCIGLILNIILDPLLIFGFGPIPALGVIGAATATLMAQILSACLIVIAAMKDKQILSHIKIRKKVHIVYVKTMLKISSPTALQSMIFTFISMTIARLIAGWGDEAIAVQKVGSQIESISWMTADGFASALSAFVAQNYGANNLKRVREGYVKAMLLMIIWGVLSSLLLLLFPGPIFKIFIREADILPKGIDYLRILGYSQLFMCMEITAAGAFSGIGKTIPPSVESITLTALRIPMAIVLGATAFGLNGIWWSISISSILKGTVLFLWFEIVFRKILRKEKMDAITN